MCIVNTGFFGHISYLENKNYQQALTLISNLLVELKRLDDNNALMKVQLLESKVCHALKNIPKSKVYNIKSNFLIFNTSNYFSISSLIHIRLP